MPRATDQIFKYIENLTDSNVSLCYKNKLIIIIYIKITLYFKDYFYGESFLSIDLQ